MGQIKNIKLHIVTDIKSRLCNSVKMVKRKVAAAEMEIPFPLKKKKVSVGSSDDSGKLDCSLPQSLMESLLGDTQLEDFTKTHWEKKPLVVKRNDQQFYGEILVLDTLKEVVKNNELDLETDINVCRVVDNEKELLNGEGQVTMDEMERLLEQEKGTVQFHHPQRYVDKLWNVVEKLETYFGCLVGSCVYVTPASSQGMAPHCDDVDVFYLQLEGTQRWKLYKPMVELSRDYNQDLLPESIGEPMLEVVLEAGDLLYFPRGVIYQSQNEDEANHSTYLSISTYQQNSWGDFMNHVVQQAIEKALEDDVSIRSGLPVNYLALLGTGKNVSAYIVDESGEFMDEKYSNLKSEKVIEFKETVKAQLAKLVDHVDVNVAADAMCADFFASRLPPYGYVKKDPTELDEREPLTQESKIKIKYPEHMRIVYDDDDENTGDHGDDTIDESDEEDEMEDDERPEMSKTTDLREKLTDSTSTSKKDATSPTSKKDTASPTSKKDATSPNSKKDATSSLIEEHEEEDEEEEDGDADIGGDMQ